MSSNLFYRPPSDQRPRVEGVHRTHNPVTMTLPTLRNGRDGFSNGNTESISFPPQPDRNRGSTAILDHHSVLQNRVVSTIEDEDEDEDEDLPLYGELALEFRSQKYAPYFRRALELDNHEGAGNSKTAELSSKDIRPGDSQKNPIIVGDDENRDDDEAGMSNDGRESRTVTPGDQENSIILEDVLEADNEVVARNDRVNKSNNCEDDPKNDNGEESDSLRPRPQDMLRENQADVGEEAEQSRRDSLQPIVDITSTEAGKEWQDKATYVEREQPTPEGSPRTQPADMRPNLDADTSTSLDDPSMKRSRSFTDADVPHPKRLCQTRAETRKAREAKEAAASFDSFGKKRLGHAFPRYCRDKEWEIDDLDDVDRAEDGSLWCTVRWKPTTLNAKTLVGVAVEKRLKELFTEKYGAEAWESRRLSQSTAGRRGRGKRGKAE